MTTRIETTILRNLIDDENYARKVLPYLKADYFRNESDKAIFVQATEFYRTYNKKPTIETLKIDLNNNKKITGPVLKDADAILESFKSSQTAPDLNWLVDRTETFCKDEAIFIAMMKSIEIAEGKTKFDKGMIPELLKEALAVTFDPRVGHDYIDESDERFTYYTNVEEKLPFDLAIMNKLTNGGVANKTLNMLLGGIHAGKTLNLCSFAASYLLQGKNVLYITLEMSDKEIGRRIDANLLDIPIADLGISSKNFFDSKIGLLKAKTTGKLKIKEYPTGGANVNNFRGLLNDLNLKGNFQPDVIIIDYLNLCTSVRFKSGDHNSYTLVKSIAEEVRGLAIEQDVPIWSATQMTRSGMSSSDPEMTDTSESIGLPAVADLMWAIYRNEDLDKQNQLMFKQLKNRYHDMSVMGKFIVGLDRVKMRLHEVVDKSATIIQDPSNVVPMSMSKPKLSTVPEKKVVWNVDE
jgi:replicative DNA helicase